jgi:hypothetical protein
MHDFFPKSLGQVVKDQEKRSSQKLKVHLVIRSHQMVLQQDLHERSTLQQQFQEQSSPHLPLGQPNVGWKNSNNILRLQVKMR